MRQALALAYRHFLAYRNPVARRLAHTLITVVYNKSVGYVLVRALYP